MLAENWTSKTEDPLSDSSNSTAATQAFNPAAPEYNVGRMGHGLSSSVDKHVLAVTAVGSC